MTGYSENIVVLKYGGTSVENTDKIIAVAKKIVHRKNTGQNVVVVVSAMGKTTDSLYNLALSISENPCKRELDALLTTGEQQSVALLCIALKELGCDAISLTGQQAGIRTNGNHTKGKIVEIDDKKIIDYLLEGKVVVVAGFQGINELGDITSLGRGGSDTTAVALAVKLNCPCEIYTDVDGVYTMDPSIYPKAKKLTEISYDKMLEMASLGAKVLDKRAIALGYKYNIPIYIGHSFKDTYGTFIRGNRIMEDYEVSGLVIDNNLLNVIIGNIPNELGNILKIFQLLDKYNIEVSMANNNLSNNYSSISFICSNEDYLVINHIKEQFDTALNTSILVEAARVSRVSLVGEGKINQIETISRLVNILNRNCLRYRSLSTSETYLSYICDEVTNLDIIKTLAEEFNL